VRAAPPRPPIVLPEGFETHEAARAMSYRELALETRGDPLAAEAIARANGAWPDSIVEGGDRIALPPPAGVTEEGGADDDMAEGDALLAHARGVFLAEEGRPAEALPFFTRAVELAPGMPEARYNLGIARLRVGDEAGAVEALRAAAWLRPGRGLYHFALGAALARRAEDGAEAREELSRALALDPQRREPYHLEARYALARLLEEMGDREGARREWQAYVAEDSLSAWGVEARRRLSELSP